MCTLIIGQNVIAPDTVILAGNRDEDPGRPSREPRVLSDSPRVVGGADALAGGTWMAVRERRAAVAMLNRWSDDGPVPRNEALRSRGLLTLDLAGVAESGALAATAHRRIQRRTRDASYAPFNAVFASPSATWAYSYSAGQWPAISTPIHYGWHVLTHRDLDDPNEPRAATLKRLLDTWRPKYPEEAREGLMELLASHEPPRVCIHAGRMVTVSSFVVWLARDGARYHHLEGRPCQRPLEDFTTLLDGAFDPGESL